MQKIAVVGSSYFEKYVEQIKTADMFPQVELFFIPDNGAPANIDINFVLNLIEEKAIQAIVLGPFDYERLAPLISIPCYIVLPNLQDFLLLHNRVKDYKKTAVVLSPQYEIDTAKRFAMRNSTVLINAETGSGKELFAQSIHGYSQRRHYPFVAINCASIPDTLIESELFGYTANSFTGASSKGKSGLIELANHGTVFLDDIDALSPSFQSKLLRVMQEREIVRIGGSAPVSVDVRFIVATNRNLSEMVARGEFRNDLYYRINILCLRIPPLRERPEDIPLLYEHYLNFFDSELAIRIHPYLHQAFFKAFSYGYPGNVRELVSVAERITALAEPERLNEGGYLSGLVSECLDIQATKEVCPNIPLLISGSYREDVRNAEYAILTHYCSANNCTMSELAKKLGISRATLYNRLRVQGKSEIT